MLHGPQSSLMGVDLTKYVQFIDKYLVKFWFNRNSVYFAGKFSNFFVAIETEPTPQLTNNFKFLKIKNKISALLSASMVNEGVDEEFRKQIIYKVVFKIGNILDTDVNQLLTWTFPHYPLFKSNKFGKKKLNCV